MKDIKPDLCAPFCSAQAPDNALAEQVEGYKAFFLNARDQLYERGADGTYRQSVINPTWYNPNDELARAMSNPSPDLTSWDDKDREFIPELQKVLGSVLIN